MKAFSKVEFCDGVLWKNYLAVIGVVGTIVTLISFFVTAEDIDRFSEKQLAAFFVAGTIHVPVGIGSVHLILNGMAGLFLGWAVFPAFLIALVLQALLFSFGGFAVLGVNLCVMALPALLVHWLFAKRLENDNSRRTQITAGIGAGVIGVGGSALLASLVLALDGGKAYSDLIMLLVISHIPVFIIDSIVSVGVVLLLNKMYPTALSVVK